MCFASGRRWISTFPVTRDGGNRSLASTAPTWSSRSAATAQCLYASRKPGPSTSGTCNCSASTGVRLGFLADVTPERDDRIASMQVLLGELLARFPPATRGSPASRGPMVREQRRTALNDVVLKRRETGPHGGFRRPRVDGRLRQHPLRRRPDRLPHPRVRRLTALSCGGPIISPQLDAVVDGTGLPAYIDGQAARDTPPGKQIEVTAARNATIRRRRSR